MGKKEEKREKKKRRKQFFENGKLQCAPYDFFPSPLSLVLLPAQYAATEKGPLFQNRRALYPAPSQLSRVPSIPRLRPHCRLLCPPPHSTLRRPRSRHVVHPPHIPSEKGPEPTLGPLFFSSLAFNSPGIPGLPESPWLALCVGLINTERFLNTNLCSAVAAAKI